MVWTQKKLNSIDITAWDNLDTRFQLTQKLSCELVLIFEISDDDLIELVRFAEEFDELLRVQEWTTIWIEEVIHKFRVSSEDMTGYNLFISSRASKIPSTSTNYYLTLELFSYSFSVLLPSSASSQSYSKLNYQSLTYQRNCPQIPRVTDLHH